jgi:hypothetical protein
VPHATPREPLGPRAAPGKYTVKLTAGGKTLTAALDVRLDPRVKLAPAAIARLGQLEERLAELVTHSSERALEAKSVSGQLAKLTSQPDALKAQISDVAAKVSAIAADPPGPRGGGGPRPLTLGGVNGKLVTFYRMIDVDAAPTAVQLRSRNPGRRSPGARSPSSTPRSPPRASLRSRRTRRPRPSRNTARRSSVAARRPLRGCSLAGHGEQ